MEALRIMNPSLYMFWRDKYPEQLFDNIAPASVTPLPFALLNLFDDVRRRQRSTHSHARSPMFRFYMCTLNAF